MVQLNEQIENMIVEEMTKSDLMKVVNKDKEFEKRVKEIARDVIIDMYRALYMHSNIFKSLSR